MISETVSGGDWEEMSKATMSEEIKCPNCGTINTYDTMIKSTEDVDYFDEDVQTQVTCTAGHGHCFKCNEMLI